MRRHDGASLVILPTLADIAGGVVARFFAPPAAFISAVLTLSCPDPGHGWLGTYSGVRPHIGSLSSADAGSKLLVQAFGPREWALTYLDDEPSP